MFAVILQDLRPTITQPYVSCSQNICIYEINCLYILEIQIQISIPCVSICRVVVLRIMNHHSIHSAVRYMKNLGYSSRVAISSMLESTQVFLSRVNSRIFQLCNYPLLHSIKYNLVTKVLNICLCLLAILLILRKLLGQLFKSGLQTTFHF